MKPAFSLVMMRLLCLAGVAGCLANCSLGFDRDWKTAAASAATREPQDLTGAWEGTWRSNHNGHHGRLRAVVTKSKSVAKPGTPPQSRSSMEVPGSTPYDFRYHATWAKVLSGGYTAYHTAGPDGTISGQQDLGKLFGGVYHYEGQSTPTTFKATYRCDIDHGVFEMSRPSAK